MIFLIVTHAQHKHAAQWKFVYITTTAVNVKLFSYFFGSILKFLYSLSNFVAMNFGDTCIVLF